MYKTAFQWQPQSNPMSEISHLQVPNEVVIKISTALPRVCICTCKKQTKMFLSKMSRFYTEGHWKRSATFILPIYMCHQNTR